MQELIRGIAELEPDDAIVFAGLLVALSLGGLWLWWSSARKGRLMANTPTSRIRSAAQGFVELDGSAHWLPDDRIQGPLTGENCVWWEFAIHEKRRVRVGKNTKTEWVRIAGARSEEIFMLQDGTGEVVVDPHKAAIHGANSHTWYGHSRRPSTRPRGGFRLGFGRYRYRESRLPLGTPLYALGWLRTETAEADDRDHRAEVAEWLRALKADKTRMLREFDTNNDGEVDSSEWEAARQQAIAAIDAELLERSLAPGVHLLHKPPDGRDYILSAQDEKTLRKKLRWQMLAGALAFFLGGVGALLIAKIHRLIAI